MKTLELRFLLVGGLALLTIVCGLGLSGSYVSADDSYNADVSLTIPVACTMTGTLNTPHTVNVEAGTYTADIGTTTLKTVCNDGNGFSIYAIGYSGLEYGNNKMLATVGGTLAPTYDIATGTAQNGNTSNWAMKLNAVSGTYAPTLTNGFGSYRTVPTEYTKVATLLSGTDATIGSSVQSTYAVYVTSLQPAGSYNGKVKYTLVHPNDADTPTQPQTTQAGKICYYPNGSNVEGTMGCQTIPTSGTTDGVSPTSAVLLASNFSRAGYGFAGWSKTFDYSDDTGFLGPQEYITFTDGQYSGSNPGLSLYAVWIKSAGSLQDSSKVATLCGTGAGSLTTAPTDGTANLSSVSALTDQRDNQTYAIAKLTDGNCWMIENLRLDNTGIHNSDGLLSEGYGTSSTYGNFSGLAEPENVEFGGHSANSLYYIGTQEGTATIDIGTKNLPSLRMPRYNNLNTSNRIYNPISNTVENSNTIGGMYSYGNYYTWHAAVADLSYKESNNQSVYGTSLCPTGWRLPQGGDKTRIVSDGDNDFWNLIVNSLNGGIKPAEYDSSMSPSYMSLSGEALIISKLRTFPNNYVYSGYFNVSSAFNRGMVGSYWTSTVRNYSSSYDMSLGDTLVSPGTSQGAMENGYSIRCIAL